MGIHKLLGIPGAIEKKAIYDQWMTLWGIIWVVLVVLGVRIFKIREML